MASHVGDASQQSHDATSQGENSTCITDIKVLNFNEFGLPIGEGSGKASSRVGELARTHVPIRYSTWASVPDEVKYKMWNSLKGEFNFTEMHKPGQLDRAREAWKKYKYKLRKNLKGNDVEIWKQTLPKKVQVSPEDWVGFCENEALESQIKLRKRNKTNNDNRKRKTTYNTGRDGYARAIAKWSKENGGRIPCRAEVWLFTHKRKKDGTYAEHDKKYAEMLQKILACQKEHEKTIENDAVTQVFGLDTRGRTRCVGSTISRTSILSSAFAREMLKEANVERDELREGLENLYEKLDLKFEELRRDLASGKYDHVGTNSAPTNSSENVASSHHDGNFNELTPYVILSHRKTIVGYGRKGKPSVVKELYGQVLEPREVLVRLEKVLEPEYELIGGTHNDYTTLGDVDIGTDIIWHDDFTRNLDS